MILLNICVVSSSLLLQQTQPPCAIFSKTIFNKENIKKLNLIFSKFSKYNSKEENNDYIYEFEINKDQLNDFFRDKTKIISKKPI